MALNKLEALLASMVNEFDEGYFNGAGCVVGVAFQKFQWDFQNMLMGVPGVTFACYNTEDRMIYLNEFFRVPIKHGMFLKEVRGILFHELVHGVISNSLQPTRLRMFHDYASNGDYHGPEFKRLEAGYTDKITKSEMDRLGPMVQMWMLQSGPA